MDDYKIALYIEQFTKLVAIISNALHLSVLEGSSNLAGSYSIEEFGEKQARPRYIASKLNDINDFIANSDTLETRQLRQTVVSLLPQLLLQYQSLRLTQINSSNVSSKESLSTWPEIVQSTGLMVPVSTCLRLIAVCLVDNEAKQLLVDSPLGVKAIVSHMVDDPLNPFQREGAIFAVKMLTMDFIPGQEALNKLNIISL